MAVKKMLSEDATTLHPGGIIQYQEYILRSEFDIVLLPFNTPLSANIIT